jgi:hypothetical protein
MSIRNPKIWAIGTIGILSGAYYSRKGFKVTNPPRIDWKSQESIPPTSGDGNIAPWEQHKSLNVATRHRINVQNLMKVRIQWSDQETARFFEWLDQTFGSDVQERIIKRESGPYGELQKFMKQMGDKLKMDQDGMAELLFTQAGITLKDRDDYMTKFGCTKATLDAINDIADLKVPLLEVGAGSGHWARALRDAGADIIATDAFTSHPTIAIHSGSTSNTMSGQLKPSEEPQAASMEKLSQSVAIMPYADTVFPVVKMDAKQSLATFPGRTLLMVYPDGPPNPFANEALEYYTKKGTSPYFIYVGEPLGGVTATLDFFETLQQGWIVHKTIDVEPFAGGVERCWILERSMGKME